MADVEKYRRWYGQIVAGAQRRPSLTGYCERHHVIPRSMDGSDAPNNIVALTYREHFLAHWLLTKFTSGTDQRKMLHALNRMRHNPSAADMVASWQYVVARRANREALLNPSPETRAKLAAAMRGDQRNRGRKHSAETREKMSAERKTRPAPSAATRAKIGARSKGNKHRLGTKHSDEVKKAMSASRTCPPAETTAKRSTSLRGNKNGLGYKFTDEQRQKSGAAKIGNKHSLGYKHSEATRLKRSAASKAMWAKRKSAVRSEVAL